MSREPLEPQVARLAARYVEHVWPKLEKKGGTPDTPMNRKDRGESSPAIGEHGLDVVHANRTASGYLRPYLDFFWASRRKAKDGSYFSVILHAVRYDPGVLETWRQGKAEGDKEALDAFYEIMRQVARGVIFTHGERNITEALANEVDSERLDVFVNPQDEQQRQQTNEGRKLDTAHTDGVIVQRVLELEAHRGLSREEAKKELAGDPENTWSYWRVERAIVDQNRRGREGVA